MLFELLVLSGAQVGSDWTSILKKRQDFRDAFSGFDAEAVANLTDKQMVSIGSEYGIDISRVRGVVDNSNRILEVTNHHILQYILCLCLSSINLFHLFCALLLRNHFLSDHGFFLWTYNLLLKRNTLV